MMFRTVVGALFFAAMTVGGGTSAGESGSTAVSLRGHLEALALKHDFVIEGADRVAEVHVADTGAGDGGRTGDDDLASRLSSLLRGYNYFLRQNQRGNVTRLAIFGPRPPLAKNPRQFRIKTTQHGPHHLVEVVLTGPNGARRRQRMILDTGASNVVLPASLASVLGFRESALKDHWADTAGGRIRAKTGWLRSVTLGGAKAEHVAVSFIADGKLGAKALLGMSFLSRFRLSMDVTENSIILMQN